MSGWVRKRFWTEAAVVEDDGGFDVRLDGRPVHTPGKARLALPTRALADAVAGEWAAQQDAVRPDTMPMTRMANSAIDKVGAQPEEVVRLLACYGETDLLCYRAALPAELARWQADAWDPWLDWLDDRYGVRLKSVEGVMPASQDPQALRRLEAELRGYSVFQLSAMHDLVALPGSLVLALAVASAGADPSAIWEQSRIDELWQIEEWGLDEEAERVNALKRSAFLDASRFFHAASDGH